MEPQDPFARAGWWGWGILVLAMILAPLSCAREARADSATVRLSIEGCRNFIDVLQQAVDARDAGIGLAAYRRYVLVRMDRAGVPPPVRLIVLREVDRAFKTRLPMEPLQLDLYTRCMTGPMGGEDV